MAWGALRVLAGRGVGKVSGAVMVLARCHLEPRSAVYVIAAGGRCLLVGVGEGPMTVLAELDAEKVRADSAASAGSPRFGEVLARVMRRPAPPESAERL
ncbi:MAG: flagellar biosynthetic protein FliO [Polyangia bacterium]